MFWSFRNLCLKLYLDVAEKEKALENLKEAKALFQEIGMDYWLEKIRKILKTVG